MINMAEILLKEEATPKVRVIIILEEGVSNSITLIWKMLMIYLKNSLEAEILLLASLKMMMTSLEEALVAIQVLEWWVIWDSRILEEISDSRIIQLKNNKKIEMILLRNSEWALMTTTIFSVEDLAEAWWAVASSNHSNQIVLAGWEVVWEHLWVNKL